VRSTLWIRWRVFIDLAVLAAAYLVASLVCRPLSHSATGVPLVWLPAGVALAAIFFLGTRRWMFVWSASLLVHWTLTSTTDPQPAFASRLLVAATIAAGDTIAALVGAFLLKRCAAGPDPCRSPRDFLRFTAFAAGGAGAVGATIALVGSYVRGEPYPGAPLLAWFEWWLARAVGIVIATPLALAWRRDRRVRWRRLGTSEGVLVFALVLVAAWAILAGIPPFDGRTAGPSAIGFQIALGAASVSSAGLAAGIERRRRSRNRLDIYRMAALQTADHWMITDVNGIVVEVNPAFENVTGYTQAELAGKRPSVIKSGVHDRAFYEHMWNTILSGEPYRGIVVNRRKNGELFYEMKTITPIMDESGRTTHFFSIGKDITELKRAEDEIKKTASDLERINQRLVASEADLLRHIRILESVLNSSTEGVIVADRNGRFLMFSPAAREMIGIGATEGGPDEWTASYGVFLPDTTTPYPTDDLPLVRAIRGEPTDAVEMFIRNPSRKDGVWLSISGRPLRDASGAVIGGVIVARDITQDRWAKKASEELRATHEEMSIAERIQKRFFPRVSPFGEGIDIAGASRPAVLTGGDYYDYLSTPDGDLLLVVGDVSGHGFGPALLMASVRAYIHALTASGVRARNMLRVLNRLVTSDTRTGDFVTLLLARVDLETGVCEYVSAGHPTGYVIDKAGDVKRRIESVVPPLGLVPEIDLDNKMSTVTLERGDQLLLLTDGIVEAENGDGACFGEECALNIVRKNRARKSSEIVDILHRTVARHCGGRLQDDITSIVFKFRPDK
jgi:PAS domain S-box-containing protein